MYFWVDNCAFGEKLYILHGEKNGLQIFPVEKKRLISYMHHHIFIVIILSHLHHYQIDVNNFYIQQGRFDLHIICRLFTHQKRKLS